MSYSEIQHKRTKRQHYNTKHKHFTVKSYFIQITHEPLRLPNTPCHHQWPGQSQVDAALWRPPVLLSPASQLLAHGPGWRLWSHMDGWMDAKPLEAMPWDCPSAVGSCFYIVGWRSQCFDFGAAVPQLIVTRDKLVVAAVVGFSSSNSHVHYNLHIIITSVEVNAISNN